MCNKYSIDRLILRVKKDGDVRMETEDLYVLQSKVSLLKAEGKYKETIEACFELLQIGLKLNNPKSVFTAHTNHAASYYSLGDIKEAFRSIEAHEIYCRKYGDELDMLNSYNVLFLLHEYNKDFANAKSTLEQSIFLGKKLKQFNKVSNGYSNYSHVCILEGNYKEALDKAQKGLEAAIKHRPKSPILELRVKLNLTDAYINLEDYDSSKVLMDGMLEDPILDSFIREKAQCYDLQGRWYKSQKLYRESFESLTYAKELVETYNDVLLLKVIQEQRNKLCELMNDIPLGYQVQKEYIALLKEVSTRELALEAQRLGVTHRIATIEKRANTDFLTGLFNREYMENTTNDWLKEASRHRESVVCIAIDIDNFKSLNDQNGHIYGDEVIKKIGKACATSCRENDIVARFGGDEFAIILKGATLENGEEKAEQILNRIRNITFEHMGEIKSITASVGVTDNLNASVLDFNTLFDLADKELYRAKENGENRISVYN